MGLVAPLAACASTGSGVPTLDWYINPDNGGQAKIAQQCSDASDGKYRIVTQLLPRDAASQREQLARRLAAHDSSIALMSLDPVVVPEFAEAGFLAPVPDDVASASTDGVAKGAVAASTWRDKIVALPFWANTQLLWYRKSVAKAAGLDMSKPVTWDQLIDAAKKTDKLLAVQGAKAESLTVWINALIASAGGEILTNPEASADDAKLGLDTPEGKAAATIMQKIGTSGVGGPGLPSEDEPASLTLFQGTNGSFMVNWPFVWTSTQTAVQSGSLDQSVLDDIGWAEYPQTTEGKQARPPFGGISLGVGAFTSHTDLAFDAAQCIVSPEHQAQYFISDGNPAASLKAYDDPKVQKAYPMYALIRKSLEDAAPRPQTPFYNQISTGLQRTWYPVNRIDPDTTPRTSSDFITAVLRGDRLL
ncbi:Trehalose-binding lipoprotein LpqY [Luteimicrobium xylanilyticum]|uniref:Trehalose-binding lipoprotein LpqY n=1 Tax=Luteimicrobium xylanilyticum TaxID=1133546 RepID=A0A5P9Q820_9MICO|nr:extracellular solute-binding protein [Luteimicrobium xylanilyticum]QFU97571.1 Trehalose-binding lipoprotein LpqY [Luteimicrobium xylanilyticum]